MSLRSPAGSRALGQQPVSTQFNNSRSSSRTGAFRGRSTRPLPPNSLPSRLNPATVRQPARSRANPPTRLPVRPSVLTTVRQPAGRRATPPTRLPVRPPVSTPVRQPAHVPARRPAGSRANQTTVIHHRVPARIGGRQRVVTWYNPLTWRNYWSEPASRWSEPVQPHGASFLTYVAWTFVALTVIAIAALALLV